MRKIILTLIYIAAATTQIVAQQATDFSFPSANGVINVSDFSYEKIVSQKGTTANISMQYAFDSLKLGSNRFVAVTPVLMTKDTSHVATFQPIVIAGRKQYVMYERDGYLLPEYENAPILKLKTLKEDGGYAYDDSTDYSSWMEGSYLYFANDLCGCCDLKDSALVGPFLRLPRNPAPYMRFPSLPDAEKVFYLHGTAYVNFVVNKTNVEPNYMNNPRELRRITDTLDIMVADKNVEVEMIRIHGYASPESPYSHNKFLAETRAQALTDYVRHFYGLPASVFAKAQATPENWGDLRDAVAKSHLANRDAILALVDQALKVTDANGSDCDAIEAKIKTQYPDDYRWLLDNVYPTLRRSDYEVTFKVRRFASDEAKDILRSNPGYLSAAELAELASLYPVGSDEYNNVFAIAEKNIAMLDDEHNITNGNITMAEAALKKGDTATADKFLSRVGDTPEADNARGVSALLKGDTVTATSLLQRASAAGITEADSNLAFIAEELAD